MLNPYDGGKKVDLGKVDLEERNEKILIQNDEGRKHLDDHLNQNFKEAAKYRLLHSRSINSSKSSLEDENLRNPPYEYESTYSSDKGTSPLTPL